MPRLLVLLLASPATDDGRRRGDEALRVAEYVAGLGDPPVALLLQGDGVGWLDEPGEPATAFKTLTGLGVPMAACELALRERGLEAAAHRHGIVAASAPERLARAVQKGWRVVTF